MPATIAILGGEVRIGLDDDALDALANTDGVAKCGVRDLAPVLARGGRRGDDRRRDLAPGRAGRASACSPPAGSAASIAARADTFDESADLGTLARVGICVVCAGVKSILDIPATLERLETLNVTVLGYRTDTFPAFYLTSSGLPVTWRVDTPAEAADGAARAARRRRAAAPSWSRTRSTSRWTRRCTSACCARACEAAAAAGVDGPRRDAVPARALPLADRGRVAARERPPRPAQRRAGGGDRGARERASSSSARSMLDVVAVHDAPLAIAQRHARADLAAARRRGREHRGVAGARGRRRDADRARRATTTRAELALRGDGRRRPARRRATRAARPARASCSSRPAASARCCPTRARTTALSADDLPDDVFAEGDVLHVSGYSLMRAGLARRRAGRRWTARATPAC